MDGSDDVVCAGSFWEVMVVVGSKEGWRRLLLVRLVRLLVVWRVITSRGGGKFCR